MTRKRKAVSASKATLKAVRAVVRAINNAPGVVSWRALNQQVQWHINDLIEEALIRRGLSPDRRPMVMRYLEDGEPFFYQRFLMMSGREQVKRIAAAIKEAR